MMHPGEVQVLGPDLWNGSLSALASFGATTGATYPLLQQGGSGAGNENLLLPYGAYDNYAVINKKGILRYLASTMGWPHGNRYHLDEIRATVDSLVGGGTVDVSDPVDPRRFVLSAAPNPFRNGTTIELSSPRETMARVTVHDLAGRVVTTLWSSALPAGLTRLEWDGRSHAGIAAPPGVYLILVRVGNERLSRRIVRVE